MLSKTSDLLPVEELWWKFPLYVPPLLTAAFDALTTRRRNLLGEDSVLADELHAMLNATSEVDVARIGERSGSGSGACERVSNRNEVYQLYVRKRPEKRGYNGWNHAVARWYYQGSSRTDTEGVAYYTEYDGNRLQPFIGGVFVVFMSDDKGNVRKSTCRFIRRDVLAAFAAGRHDTWRCEGDWLNEDLLCGL